MSENSEMFGIFSIKPNREASDDSPVTISNTAMPSMIEYILVIAQLFEWFFDFGCLVGHVPYRCVLVVIVQYHIVGCSDYGVPARFPVDIGCWLQNLGFFVPAVEFAVLGVVVAYKSATAKTPR